MYALENENVPRRRSTAEAFVPHDEIKKFRDARYVTTSEACWRTLGYSLSGIKPDVERLDVHLEDQQGVRYHVCIIHEVSCLDRSICSVIQMMQMTIQTMQVTMRPHLWWVSAITMHAYI